MKQQSLESFRDSLCVEGKLMRCISCKQAIEVL